MYSSQIVLLLLIPECILLMIIYTFAIILLEFWLQAFTCNRLLKQLVYFFHHWCNFSLLQYYFMTFIFNIYSHTEGKQHWALLCANTFLCCWQLSSFIFSLLLPHAQHCAALCTLCFYVKVSLFVSSKTAIFVLHSYFTWRECTVYQKSIKQNVTIATNCHHIKPEVQIKIPQKPHPLCYFMHEHVKIWKIRSLFFHSHSMRPNPKGTLQTYCGTWIAPSFKAQTGERQRSGSDAKLFSKQWQRQKVIQGQVHVVDFRKPLGPAPSSFSSTVNLSR